MEKIPRMSRTMRRQPIRLGRRSGEPETALRFLAISRLGPGHRSPRVAAELTSPARRWCGLPTVSPPKESTASTTGVLRP